MKLFKQVNVGDEVVIINSYNREKVPKEIFIVSHIEQDDEDSLKIIVQKEDEEFDFYANSNQSFILYPWRRNSIITPKENFQHVQKIFNVGYLFGENNIRNNIKDILHI